MPLAFVGYIMMLLLLLLLQDEDKQNYSDIHKCVKQDGRQRNLPALFHHSRAEIHYTSHTIICAHFEKFKSLGEERESVTCMLCVRYMHTDEIRFSVRMEREKRLGRRAVSDYIPRTHLCSL